MSIKTPPRDVANSPGGDINSLFAAYDTMQYIKPDVSTIVMGQAAAVLLAAGTKGKRFALPHSRVVIHQPLGGAEGQAVDIIMTAEQAKEYGMIDDRHIQPQGAG